MYRVCNVSGFVEYAAHFEFAFLTLVERMSKIWTTGGVCAELWYDFTCGHAKELGSPNNPRFALESQTTTSK